MKFTQGKLMETLRRKNEDWTTYQARKIAGVSVRRVNQLWSEYLETGQVPELGRKMGRPTRPIEDWEIELVKVTYPKYRVSAHTLMRVIERDYGKHINHNRVHRIMLDLGFAKKKTKKDKRKKDWIRYERRHSLSAVHIDWYYDAVSLKYAYAVIDDASRYLLALLEVDSATTEYSIEGMIKALKHGKIRECISDHGTQFIKQEGMESSFAGFLVKVGIKQILCRIKHPQANGKVEKFFDLYKNHRHAFSSDEEFIVWYNEVRPHSSLNFQVLETPIQAFLRKMRKEVI
jgi:putative transposase